MSDTGIETVAALRASSRFDAGSLRRIAAKGEEGERLEEVANQLEGVFMSLLVKTMRESMSESDLFGGVTGGDVYGGMFDQLMGEELSRRGGLGLAEMVIRSSAEALEGVPLGEVLAARDAASSGESEEDSAGVVGR